MGRGPRPTGGGPCPSQHCPASRAPHPTPPPGQEMQGHCSRSGPLIGVIRGLSRIRRISTTLLPVELKDCLGLLDGEGGEDVSTFVQLLLFGVGLEARVRLATRIMADDIFSPPRGGARPPRVHTPPPVPLPLRPRHLPRHCARGGHLIWNGAYEMEVMKGDPTDGDVEVTWALGAMLSPTRPALAWQLIHGELAWKRAKESKKAKWTVTCLCECEVCIVFYPVFAQNWREVRANFATLCCAFANASDSVRHANS